MPINIIAWYKKLISVTKLKNVKLYHIRDNTFYKMTYCLTLVNIVMREISS